MASLTLSIVNDAIIALLTGGQSYSRAGFSFTRAQLPALTKLRDKMIVETQREGTDGASFVFDMSRGTAGETESEEWGI